MIGLIIVLMVLFSAYIFISTGSLISEKIGVANISVEGNAIMGAAFYVLFMSYFGSENYFDNNTLLLIFAPLISIIISGVLVAMISTIFASITVKLYSDQIITGTAINLFAPAFSTILLFLFYQQEGTNPIGNAVVQTPDYLLAAGFEWIYPIIFLALAISLLFFMYFIFKQTRLGLRMRASGENPYALETSGVSVHKIRFITLIFAGLLSGVGGSIWAFVMGIEGNRYYSTVFGMGYMAIGIVIFSQWKIKYIAIGSFIVAFFTTITSTAGILALLPNAADALILIMRLMPYVVPIVILIIFKSSGAPKEIGKAFKKDQR